MKNTLLFLFTILISFVSSAQDSKATPPYEATQYVQNIIQELEIPDETFDKMREKDNIIQVKLFLSDKGEVTKASIPNDDFELETLIVPIVKQLPNFNPAIVDGTSKASLYNLSFVINEYNYYKAVRHKATPINGMEKFGDKVRNNFYITDQERSNLSVAKTKTTLDIAIDFIIEKDGSVSSFRMVDPELEYFNKRMTQAVKRATKKWIPGTINGLPVRTKFTYTLAIRVDFHSLNI